MSTSAVSQNIKAGTFVLAGVALAIASIFVLSNAWATFFGTQMSSYVVTYPVLDGVGYLATGSPVRIGGISAGTIEQVQLSHTDAPVESIAVTFTLPANIELFSNAVILVRSALIGNTSSLDIISVGFDAPHTPAGARAAPGTSVAAGGTLKGTLSGGLLGSLLGPAGANSTSAMLGNMEAISAKLRKDGGLLPWAFGDAVASSLTAGMSDMGDIMKRLSTNGEVLEWVLGPSSSATVRNAVASAQNTLASLQAHWPLWSQAIGSTLANLDLTGQQLNLMVQELRNSPWRLLYRPTVEQASQELLYEASRNFVFGAADLKSAVKGMDHLVEAYGEAAAEQPAFVLLRENLMQAAKRYERAEQQLMQVLQKTGDVETP
jgi:ABC-type transporter Mla subunit MlaD